MDCQCLLLAAKTSLKPRNTERAVTCRICKQCVPECCHHCIFLVSALPTWTLCCTQVHDRQMMRTLAGAGPMCGVTQSETFPVVSGLHHCWMLLCPPTGCCAAAAKVWYFVTYKLFRTGKTACETKYHSEGMHIFCSQWVSHTAILSYLVEHLMYSHGPQVCQSALAN